MPPAPSIPALTLGLGLTANAWFFFGNLAESLMGPASIVNSAEKRQKYGLDAGKSAEMFAVFFHSAKIPFGSASALTSIFYFTTAYLRRKSLIATHTTPVLTTAGLLALFPLPWTALVMMPNIKKLLSKASKSASGNAEVQSEKALAEFDSEMQLWVNHNTVRFTTLGVSYFLALYTLLV